MQAGVPVHSVKGRRVMAENLPENADFNFLCQLRALSGSFG